MDAAPSDANPPDLTAGGLLKGVLEGVRRHPVPLLLPLSAAGFLASVASVGITMWARVPLGPDPFATPPTAFPGVVLAILTASLGALVLSVLLHAYGWAFTTRATLDVLDHRDAEDLGSVASRTHALFAPALIVFVLYVLAIAFGLIAIVVPGVIVTVGLLPAVAVVFGEERTGTDALTRAWHLTSGHKWHLFILLLLYLAAILFVNLLTGLLPLDTAQVASGTLNGTLLGLWCALGALFHHRRTRLEHAGGRNDDDLYGTPPPAPPS